MGSSECGMWVAKYILCIFNFLFHLLGTILLGVGVWLALDKASLIALFKLVENEHVYEFSEPQLIEHFAYALIALGAIIFFLTFLGYWGAIRESRCLLAAYAIFMLLLLTAEIAACGLAAFYKNQARNETKSYLQSTITNYYKSGGTNPDAVTLMWNQMMSSFACCGVNDYRDFEMSHAWITNKGNRTIPEACCILKDVSNLVPRDNDCVTNPNENNSFYKKGCYDVFFDWIISHREIVVGVLLGVCIIEVLTIFLAFCLCSAYAKYHGMRL